LSFAILHRKLSTITAVLLCLTLIACGTEITTITVPEVNSALEPTESKPDPAPPVETTSLESSALSNSPDKQNTSDAKHDHADHDSHDHTDHGKNNDEPECEHPPEFYIGKDHPCNTEGQDDHQEEDQGPGPNQPIMDDSSNNPALRAKGKGTLSMINLLTKYKTSDLKSWAKQVESRMAERQSNVLVVMYPLGKFAKMGGNFGNHPLETHERLVTQDQIDSMLKEIETWAKTQPHRDGWLANEIPQYRLIMEGGGDVAVQTALSKGSRLVVIAAEENKDPSDVYHTFTHELYHAFQHDIGDIPCDRQDGGRWMVEAGADYFSYLEIAKSFPHRSPGLSIMLESASNTYRDEGSKAIRGSSTAAAALLRLLVERGHIAHEKIIDGSIFHNCVRNEEFSSDQDFVSDAMNSWHMIEDKDGTFQFSQDALKKTASKIAARPVASISSNVAITATPLIVSNCDDKRIDIPDAVRTTLSNVGFSQCSMPFGILLAADKAMPEDVVRHAAKITAEFIDKDMDGLADDPKLATTLQYKFGQDRAWLSMPTKHGFKEGPGGEALQSLGYDIEIPSWWLWGEAGLQGDFSEGLNDHSKRVIWEEVDHFMTQFGLSKVYPKEFGLEDWDSSVLARETKRAQCQWWQHPENDCPGSPRETDGPPDGCTDISCDAVEFFHQLHTLYVGMEPGWSGIGFPKDKSKLVSLMSVEMKTIMNNTSLPVLKAPLKQTYPVAN